MSTTRPPGFEQRARGFDRERAGGIEDDVEPLRERRRVKVEVDDWGDAERDRFLSGAGAATTADRRAMYHRDLGGGAADPAKAAVDEHALSGLELALS